MEAVSPCSDCHGNRLFQLVQISISLLCYFSKVKSSKQKTTHKKEEQNSILDFYQEVRFYFEHYVVRMFRRNIYINSFVGFLYVFQKRIKKFTSASVESSEIKVFLFGIVETSMSSSQLATARQLERSLSLGAKFFLNQNASLFLN